MYMYICVCTHTYAYMPCGCFYKLGFSFAGALMIRALLNSGSMLGSDWGKLPHGLINEYNLNDMAEYDLRYIT